MAFWDTDFAFYNPWRELHAIQRRMDDLMSVFEDDFLYPEVTAPRSNKHLTSGKDETVKGETKEKNTNKPLATTSNNNNELMNIRQWRPICDISENDKEIVVHAELPGIEKDNLSVKVENNVLTLSGERKREVKDENDKYRRVERSYGKFSRSIRLPEGVDPAAISADYDNGVLKVTVPKPAKPAPQAHTIEIKHSGGATQPQQPAESASASASQ
jgi:HSP20 family molecular chaperone IbpA